tara:strand:- start:14677 stop:15132 length:456 start_codon:yes stop_codon:yes gene_type:complete
VIGVEHARIKGETLMPKESHMANVTNIRECAQAYLNPKTKAEALARAKVRAPHKRAWANLLKAMETDDLVRVTARASGDWTAVTAERTKAKATAKPKAKATPKAKVVAKAVAPVVAKGNGMVEALAGLVGQMDGDAQMAFLNLVAKGITKK